MPYQKWLHRYACLTAWATVFLLFAGGMVTSTGSGLAVPDWPLSYGMLFPPMVGGVFYEHGHRMVAATVGMMTVGLCLWLWLKEPRRWVRWVGTAAVLTVVAQGVLGGITVLFLLPTPVSVGHAALAEIFFCLTVSLALFTSKEWIQKTDEAVPVNERFRRLSVVTVIVIYIQILLGALMRHTESGLAIPDFPLSFGRLIPPEWTFKIAIHFAHRMGAATVSVFVILLAVKALRWHGNEARFSRPAIGLLVLLLLQILLGATTIWTEKAPTIATLHLTFGAMMLALSVMIMLRSYRSLKPEEAQEGIPTRGALGGAGTQRLYAAGSRRERSRERESVRRRAPGGDTLLGFLGQWINKLDAYYQLTKPRINILVVFTTVVGFVLAVDTLFPWSLFFHTLIGTFLVALGSCALNECWEKNLDAKMNRTRTRPLPAGKLAPREAWIFSSLISLAGLFYLYYFVNHLSFILALLTLGIYVFIYTPFKRRSSLCTLVGAVTGAIPPMIGWAAVQNKLGAPAWILFAILFIWQLPTFLSVAWIYRQDYSRAGFPMLTVADAAGKATSSQILLNTVALLWVSLMPTVIGFTQWFYFFGALLLGLVYFAVGYRFSRQAEILERHARKIFLTSMLYLPALLILMILDKSVL